MRASRGAGRRMAGPAASHVAGRVSALACASLLLAAGGCGDENNPAPPQGADAGIDAALPADAAPAPACPEPEALWFDVNLPEFQTIPARTELDLSAITPAEPATYLELRFAGLGDDYEVVASTGSLCAGAQDQAACEAEFRALSSDTGFGIGCLPGYCFHYLAVNRVDGDAVTNMVIDQSSELIELLGTIDTEIEAVLVAFAGGYSWSSSDPSAAGVRLVDDGYELLVTDLVSDCLPVQTDRFLLFVSISGEIEVRRQQPYSVLCGACI